MNARGINALASGWLISHTASMKKWILLVLSFALLGLVTGCIEYERQTMSFRHEPATDTLYIFQDYQGIFGVDDPASLSDGEVDQLASVFRGERTFFYNNWITEYNREHLQERLRTPKGELDKDEAYEAAIRTAAELALANVKVENIGFYFNQDSQLCGAQRVTVKNTSKVLASLNKLLLFLMRDLATRDDTSAEDKKLMLKFADSAQNVLRLDGNRLEIRWACSEADYRKFKDQTPQGKGFRESGGEVSHADGVITLVLGKKDAQSTSLTMPFSEHPYVSNALAEARKQGIKPSYDAAAAAKAFLDEAGKSK